jgi:L-lysine 6-transaminase
MQDRGVLDSTWGGNLADMVRFVQEMRVVEDEKLIEQVPAKAFKLQQGLEALAQKFFDIIFNVRGMGLYQGFSFRRREQRRKFLDDVLENEKLLLLSAGAQTVRLRPPLTVTEDEIAALLTILDRSLLKLRN